GLSTLTVLNECRRLIKEKEKDIEFEEIPLDDPKVYEELSKGNTVGTFQFSGYACTELIKRMGVERFEDLAHVISLARPGPTESGMTDLFVERKHGKSWTRKNLVYEKITEQTYGVLVYQEQVMDVFHKVAGLPYSTADKVRKVIGKKRDAKEFGPYRIEFIAGCKKQKTFSEKEANEFWKGLLEWAHYGFNKAHATEYAMIGYWTAFLKFNFPQEFLCAALTYEPDSMKNKLVKEAYRLGFEVMPPKVGISDSRRWLTRGNVLYAPFISIKGLGEKTALKASTMAKTFQKLRQGFFDSQIQQEEKKKKTKLESILEEVGAFDPQAIPKGISQYFSFTISHDPRVLYPNLFKVFPNIRPAQTDEIVKGLLPFPEIFRKIRFDNDYLLECKDCKLREECRAPVMPSKGLYNVIIAGEGPGKDEDLERKGFVGLAGKDVLWPELEKYGLKRSRFHVTNVCKCYPRLTKTPEKEHIQKCMPWLREEMEAIDCRLMLVFGNTGVKAFLDEDGGITKKNGVTEWVDRWRTWICWCVHPASVLHNPKTNKELFEAGIRNFEQTMRNLGLKEIFK
ncbi:MAG: uracil-DNA glycosylase family protein, partial [Pseudomonadota bacterium]